MMATGSGFAPGRAVRTLGAVILGLALSAAMPGERVLAHGGGTPRLTKQAAGPYRLYAWTEPEPMRVGEAHLTIAVTQAAGANAQPGEVETPVSDAAVVVTFTPLEGSVPPLEVRAGTQSALGDVYYEADTVLPSDGDWRISITVEGREGRGQGDFSVAVEAARRLNWTLMAIGGILLLGATALIAVRSAERNPQPTPPHHARRAIRAPQ